jgi:hypothetical protein
LQQVPGVPFVGLLAARITARVAVASPIRNSCPNRVSRRWNQRMLPLLSTPTSTGPVSDW